MAYRAYFKKRAEEIFAKNGIDADILVYSKETVQELPRRGYLALLARGGTAEELRQQVDIPVVDIPIMFQDIAAALLQARQYGPRIGVVGYGNFLNHLEELNPILDGEISQKVARSAEETRRSIQGLQAMGCDAIIGGYQQVEIAGELGLHHVLLDLYEDPLMEAYHQAEVIAGSVLRNARKQEELHTILSTTKEAFIAIDRDGRITVMNPAALRLTQISVGKVIGQPLEQVRRLLMRDPRLYDRMLLMMDSLGLGVFTVVGIQTAYGCVESPSWFLLAFVGVVTGVGGGVLRDIMAGDVPYIFRKHIYASASLAGALLCAGTWKLVGEMPAVLAGTGSVLAIRGLSAHFRWDLPQAKRELDS